MNTTGKLLINTIENGRNWLSFRQVAVICWLSALLALTGCTSKATAKSREHAAFVEGQEEVLMRLQQARDTNVTLIGPVRNPVVPWTEDLTLAKALVAAEYQSRRNPRQIIILRGGQAIPVDPNQLVNGEDVPLQAGDRVEIRE
jgi:hypothetical protein